jgi:hypothetical protein
MGGMARWLLVLLALSTLAGCYVTPMYARPYPRRVIVVHDHHHWR